MWHLALHRFTRKDFVGLCVLPGLALLGGLTEATGVAQQSPSAQAQLERRIANEIKWIHDSEKEGLAPLKLGWLWAHLASDYEDEMELEKSEAAYNRALHLLEPLPDAQKDYAIVLDDLGSLYVMSGRFDESERCRKKAQAVREKTGDQLEVARGKAHLAEVHLGRHKYKDARQEAQEAYTTMIAMKEPEVSHVVAALVTVIYSECAMNQCKPALDHAQTALSLASNANPLDILALGQAHLALGYAEWRNGIRGNPEEELREGIRIMRSQELPTHPYVLSAMEQYRIYLESEHRKTEARQIADQMRAITEKPADACPQCTVSVYGLRSH